MKNAKAPQTEFELCFGPQCDIILFTLPLCLLRFVFVFARFVNFHKNSLIIIRQTHIHSNLDVRQSHITRLWPTAVPVIVVVVSVADVVVITRNNKTA